MKYYTLLTACILFSSCQDKIVKKYYYSTGELWSEVELNKENQNDGSLKKYYKTGELEGICFYINGEKQGELREYYKTGELKLLEHYEKGMIVDTSKRFFKNGNVSIKQYSTNLDDIYERYYENGSIMSKGFIQDTILKGWWYYYDQEGNLNKKVEYIDVSGDPIMENLQYPNQIIFFDKKGNILRDSSNYYTIDLKDTIPLGKLALGHINLVPQISKESDFHMVYYWSQDEDGNKTKIDSTYGKNEKQADLWLVPKTKGGHTLSGYILEKGIKFRGNQQDTSMVDVIDITKKLFFEKNFYVKDTIE